ncbi:MAG TPA: hypothetical protein EYP18_04845 [Desulfobacterales bacterium]|nr:hypothetical protein [Desulfobacterales bacterium]
MNINETELIKKYRELSDIELIELKKSGELTEIATITIENVLEEREITEDKFAKIQKEDIQKKIILTQQTPLPNKPKIWIGYLIAFAIICVQIVGIVTDNITNSQTIAIVLSITGGLYWLFCIKELHSILGAISIETYPISPGKAAAFHFIPFFNIYWIFKWPIELSRFINKSENEKMVHGSVIGILILIGIFLRIFDSAIGLTWLFTILIFLNKKISQRIKNTKDS